MGFFFHRSRNDSSNRSVGDPVFNEQEHADDDVLERKQYGIDGDY